MALERELRGSCKSISLIDEFSYEFSGCSDQGRISCTCCKAGASRSCVAFSCASTSHTFDNRSQDTTHTEMNNRLYAMRDRYQVAIPEKQACLLSVWTFCQGCIFFPKIDFFINHYLET